MKKILLFAALLCAAVSFTQAQNTDVTVSPNYVKYWVGTGSNQAIFIVNWCDPDTALAWGYRFNGDSVLVSTMLTDIVAADSRLGFSGTVSWLSDLYYSEGADTFHILPANDIDYVVYNVSGGYADVADVQYFYPGDYVKFGGYSCSLPGDSVWIEDPYYGNYWLHASVWNTPIEPVEIPGVPAEDATFSASDILYWVGTGSNEALFIVNWCDPDTALAWGYRFDGTAVTALKMLRDIHDADPRLYAAFVTMPMATTVLSSISFNNGEQVYDMYPGSLVYNQNGSIAYAVDYQFVYPGDYLKFGDYSCAQKGQSVWVYDPVFGVDSDYCYYWKYAFVWNTPIAAVTPPTGVADYEQTTLSVYPNPCTGSVRIQTESDETVVLYNLQGAEVMRTVARDGVTTLDVNELPAGVYFVKSGARTAKIVKR